MPFIQMYPNFELHFVLIFNVLHLHRDLFSCKYEESYKY